ncbi:type VI secretion system-associated protein [Helicobacter sp. 12S02232-10]|uniref:type VI secretion system baseplate subunit TssK n=1 Tax=Helicobacter sp. 12S02232-10 TaxID=1476197 RepID=UPI000BA5DCE9|nr:type VI secretion system baseplate subunit TssK [Helicobacter sp. 12S02232-10]PAF46718.1 type VI secretion system-associated protein [Helicobacter sp. 12S02232-10]
MANNLKVVWLNGMNVDRVHFEQQERYLERNINQKTIMAHNNLYGISKIEFSAEMLLQGKIALSKISGISIDGSVFNAPDEDFLPEPLDLKEEALAGSVIVLKIPASIDTKADLSVQNSIPDTKFLSTQSVISSKISDDTSANNLGSIEDNMISSVHSQEKINVVLASLRLSLGIKSANSSDYSEIPICRIGSVSVDKKITLDDKFIPTMLDISKLPIIKSYIDEIVYSINQHKSLLNQSFKGLSRTKNILDFSTYLSLSILKKWYMIFSYIKNKSILHPEYFYEKLIEFQADLLSFGDEDQAQEFIRYNHAEITDSIIPLINITKMLFSRTTTPKYIMPNVVDNQNGFYDCIFDNAGILQSSILILAISADAGLEYLVNNFKTQSKIYTPTKIRNIVASQLRGINIEQLSIVPTDIPHMNNYVYYQIDKSDNNWLAFKEENTISIYVTNKIPNVDIKMWALIK